MKFSSLYFIQFCIKCNKIWHKQQIIHDTTHGNDISVDKSHMEISANQGSISLTQDQILCWKFLSVYIDFNISFCSYRAIYRVTHARGSCEDHPWAKVLKHGAEVCVECQPTSMNKRLERCRGHGVFRQETMWNAIEVKNCHGKWKMITHHESETCNHQGDHDFVLV